MKKQTTLHFWFSNKIVTVLRQFEVEDPHKLGMGGLLWAISANIMPVFGLAPGPLLTKRTDVLPLNLMKSRSRDIGCYNNRIAL